MNGKIKIMYMKNKTIITVTCIRPDFIRMSEIFKKLDENFNHILIHTGQHFDKLLSDVFFDELEIREPNYNLNIGGLGKEHFHQTAELSVKLIELIRIKNLNPDLILFLGDSNSVCSAMSLKKEGYKIGHIEAGMRSYDKRMLEEINRVVCDHCSDYLFVYHENYKQKAIKENINEESIFVVGNTIVEVVKNHIPQENKKNDRIILDIHRPENFKYKDRLQNIINYTSQISKNYNLPVYMLGFKRTLEHIKEFSIDLKNIKVIDLLPFKEYVNQVYHSKFIISDSGTAQEEPAILNTPVIVPRDFTERPESVDNNCSFMIDVNTDKNSTWANSESWLLLKSNNKKIEWLGNGNTSDKIINILKKNL
jgi:UDP-N-acetylglucosamine 2-epimerase (non-hydrolysing)